VVRDAISIIALATK